MRKAFIFIFILLVVLSVIGVWDNRTRNVNVDVNEEYLENIAHPNSLTSHEDSIQYFILYCNNMWDEIIECESFDELKQKGTLANVNLRDDFKEWEVYLSQDDKILLKKSFMDRSKAFLYFIKKIADNENQEFLLDDETMDYYLSSIERGCDLVFDTLQTLHSFVEWNYNSFLQNTQK